MSENMTPIAELCRRHKVSQTELSRIFDIPLRTVQDWHAGRRKAPDYVVKMMDRLLTID